MRTMFGYVYPKLCVTVQRALDDVFKRPAIHMKRAASRGHDTGMADAKSWIYMSRRATSRLSLSSSSSARSAAMACPMR